MTASCSAAAYMQNHTYHMHVCSVPATGTHWHLFAMGVVSTYNVRTLNVYCAAHIVHISSKRMQHSEHAAGSFVREGS